MNNAPDGGTVPIRRSAMGASRKQAKTSVLADRIERYGLMVAWAALIVVFGLLKPGTFFTWGTFSTILGSQSVLVIITLGLIIPLTANDFDVSIASMTTFSSMTIAVLNVNHQVPIGWAIVVALASGLALGFVNGFFIIVFRSIRSSLRRHPGPFSTGSRCGCLIR